MKALTIFFVFMTIIAFDNNVLACSCARTESICEAFARADAVFAGIVERVEDKKGMLDGREIIAGQVAYVQVVEAFKGVKQSEMVFRTSAYRTSCDVSYKAGHRWLFYASYDKASNAWGIFQCDRSNDLESAADDLLYLRGLPGSAQRTRLSGTLIGASGQPLTGAKVKVIGGEQTYELYTNQNGVYEAFGLPPGKYSIKPATPPNLKQSWSAATGLVRDGNIVLLEARSCAGVDFWYKQNKAIKRSK